jgi:hypothetical protein
MAMLCKIMKLLIIICNAVISIYEDSSKRQSPEWLVILDRVSPMVKRMLRGVLQLLNLFSILTENDECPTDHAIDHVT